MPAIGEPGKARRHHTGEGGRGRGRVVLEVKEIKARSVARTWVHMAGMNLIIRRKDNRLLTTVLDLNLPADFAPQCDFANLIVCVLEVSIKGEISKATPSIIVLQR